MKIKYIKLIFTDISFSGKSRSRYITPVFHTGLTPESIDWAITLLSTVIWLWVFNSRPMTDLLQQTFLEQFTSCSSKLFCHWLTWGKRETSRTDLNDNALLTKGTDIIAPCMSEITSTYNICKSSTTSIRPGKMEKQAHTNGRMKEFWRYL